MRWHGGAFNGTNQVWTCAITFPDGTEAAMIVNSPLVQGSACTVRWQPGRRPSSPRDHERIGTANRAVPICV